jgi:hypothetical protein
MKVPRPASLGIVLLTALLSASEAAAVEWFVAPGASGTGTRAAPFGRVQDALDMARPGDVITLAPGTYQERVRSTRSGTRREPIRLRGTGARDVLLTTSGRVVTIAHEHLVLENLVIDGQYGASDTLRVESSGHHFTLRNVEVRRSSRDLIDMGGPVGVLIDGCLIHRALNAANGRTDAHGIAAGPVQRLTIRNTEIHTFSGDAFQVDPGRSAPGWNNVTLDTVRFWLAPLEAPENGFAAGVVPGENAIDTKASAALPRATLTMRNVTAHGFRGGLINNMAAFNLKEHINATLDGVTVFDSEIAFRMRGDGNAPTGAWVTLMNAVVYDVQTAYRYEEDIQNLRIWNNTVGGNVERVFRAAASNSSGLTVRNLLVLGPRPAEAADPSNLAVGDRTFVDASRHDYRLVAGAPAVDTGVAIAGMTIDRDGVKRPVGGGVDVGAYEWQPSNGSAGGAAPVAKKRVERRKQQRRGR